MPAPKDFVIEKLTENDLQGLDESQLLEKLNLYSNLLQQQIEKAARGVVAAKKRLRKLTLVLALVGKFYRKQSVKK